MTIEVNGGPSHSGARTRPDDSLEDELAETRLLQSISEQLIHEDSSDALYERIVDAAVLIMGADFASMQMLSEERGNGPELRLLAYRGFNPEAAKFWEWVRIDSNSTCGVALRTGQRVIAADVDAATFMAGTDDLDMYRNTGIRAVQTTPLTSRGGHLVGMISTHWREPHDPSERRLRMLDLLARQAADLIERQQSMDMLRARTEQFATLLREAPMGVYLVDADFRMQEVNPAARPAFGDIPGGLIGRDFSEVVHIIWNKEFADEVVEIFRRTQRTGEAYISPERAELRADRGVIEYYDWRVDRIVLPDGRYGMVCYFTNVSQQVTDRKAIARSEERFRSLVSVITDVPWTTNAAGEFDSPQPSWAAFTGQTWDAYRGNGWANAMHPDDRDSIRAAWDNARAKGIVYESRGRLWHASSGEYRHFLARGAPISGEDGEVREWVGTCNDVHEQRIAQEEVQRASQLKDQLLGMVSHEFRSPLTTIIGNISALNRFDSLDPGERGQVISDLRRESERLRRLIENMLFIASSESRSAPDTEPLLLQRSLPKIIDAEQQHDRSRPLTLTIRADLPPVLGNLGSIEQLLENLLTNARKYGRAETEICVDVAIGEECAIVSVSDEGDPLDGIEVERFFEPFYRQEQTTEGIGGTGLGLAVCARLARMMGGAIIARPRVGGGLEVQFTIPFAE